MTELNYQHLDRELDKVKSKVFLGNNAAFLGPLMCSVKFMWIESIKTAQTNGINLHWNPHFFMQIPFDSRLSVLLHELWHVALCHPLRCGPRNPKVWNWACDIWINDMLATAGYTFEGLTPWMSDNLNQWRAPNSVYIGDYPTTMSVEVIYDILISLLPEGLDKPIWIPGGDISDIINVDDVGGAGSAAQTIINNVIGAATAAKLCGKGNAIPGEIETMLKRFLHHKLPWEQLLYRFFESRGGQDYSFARPNRRYEDIYLPSLAEANEGLNHIGYYLDVSGSVTDPEVVRFNSEVKYIKDNFEPERLSLILFDEIIQKVTEYSREDSFDEVIIVGRKGTDLACVREHILKTRPTTVVIFSDLCCPPMEPLGIDIPTIWVGVNARPDSKVNFGKLIHIKE